MADFVQIICAVLIVAAAVFYIYRSVKRPAGESRLQMVLAVFQVLLCGWFFALCISDVLDIQVNFSLMRLILDICYALAFLAITIYTLFLRHKENSWYFKSIICAFLLLIVLQCFVFPYGTEDIVLRIFEYVEGAVVFGLLIAILFKLENASFTASSLIIALILELIVAVENVLMPFSSITDDFQAVDIPLNYLSLFMRPVLFASLALAYRAWLNRRNRTDWISQENCFHRLTQIFIRPYTAGARLVEDKAVGTSILAVLLHVLSSGTFFYLLVTKTDGLIQQLVTWLRDGAGDMIRSLTDTVISFLHTHVVSWIGTIPVIGEAFQEPARGLASDGVTSLSTQAQTYVDAFFQDLAQSLKLPSLLAFGVSALIVAVLIMLLVLMIWAMLKITKHKWCSFRQAFCLSAIRSTVTVPFAIVSGLLVCINPLYGIILFAFAIFWSMGHMYTTIMAGADQTSGNRSAAWFPPILILMYLLTAAVMIAVIVLAGWTLYNQVSDLAVHYINAITALFTG